MEMQQQTYQYDDLNPWSQLKAHDDWLSHMTNNDLVNAEEYQEAIECMGQYFGIRIKNYRLGSCRGDDIEWERRNPLFDYDTEMGLSRVMAWFESHVLRYGKAYKQYYKHGGHRALRRKSKIKIDSWLRFPECTYTLFAYTCRETWDWLASLRNQKWAKKHYSVAMLIFEFEGILMQTYQKELSYYSSIRYFEDEIANTYEYREDGSIIW